MTDLQVNELTPSKSRILNAALKLFSHQGVAATSLQMIADEIGLTKAAVYHQFKTKEEIVLAAVTLIVGPLELAAKRAASEKSLSKRRRVLVDGLIDQAVESRRLASFLQRDPYVLSLFEKHERFRRLMERLVDLLIGGSNAEKDKVTAATVLTAIGATVMHPMVSQVDNEDLRRQLRVLMNSLLRQLTH